MHIKKEKMFIWARKNNGCEIIDGEYYFSCNEVAKIKPELVEEIEYEKVKYSDEKEFNKAIAYMLKKHGGWECWDSEKKVLISEIND